MHGMFRANGGCGYIKKPDFLLKPGAENEIFYDNAGLPVKTTLKVVADLLLQAFSFLKFSAYFEFKMPA